ncbi:MAG: hypothetical protein K2X38_25510 [Gemmataceae bacterium]|nr:hypothetical protein [Gemmataceae bacterium]
MDPPVAEQPEPAKPQVQIESPPEPPEQAPPSVQPPAPEPAQVAPPPQLDTDHIQQLISEFGRDMAAQILAASGVQLPQEEAKASSAPSASRPALAEDGFDPVAIAEQRIERERKARLVEEEYRRLNPPPPELPFDPMALAKKRIEREEQLEAAEAEYKKLKPPEPEPAFDPLAIAKKRVEREEQIAAADAEYRKLKPPAPEPTFDPLDVAKRRIEREVQQAAAEEEYRKLKPPEAEPVFDPMAVAKKRVEREEQLAAADAEYRKLKPPEAFDPAAEAKKRVEGEDRKAAIDEEYKRLRPPEPEKPFDPFEAAQKSREGALKAERISAAYEAMYGAADKAKGVFDQTLDIADRFRGTVGGVFGTLVGAGLDIAAMVRKEMVPPKSPLRREAERLNAQAAPMQAAAPVAPKAEAPPPLEPIAPPEPPPAPAMEPLEVGGKTFEWEDSPDLVQQTPEVQPKAVEAPGVDEMGQALQSLTAETQAATQATGEFAGTASTAMSALGPVGTAAAVAAVGITAMTAAALEFDSAVTSRAEKYAAYSPQLAMAQAQIDVQRMMADMRRAQEYGPQLAQYLQARADLEQKWEEAKVQFMMKMLPLAELIVKMLGGVVDAVGFLTDPLGSIEKWTKATAQNTSPAVVLDETTPWSTVMGAFYNPTGPVTGTSGGGAMVTPMV